MIFTKWRKITENYNKYKKITENVKKTEKIGKSYRKLKINSKKFQKKIHFFKSRLYKLLSHNMQFVLKITSHFF